MLTSTTIPRLVWASRSRGVRASDPRGIDQVGCVYTAQGFEFDHVGVIVVPDLIHWPMDEGWVGQRDQAHDRVVRRGVSSADFTRYVKGTYRVLVTRGLRCCSVHFMDSPTRDFFLSRTERVGSRRRCCRTETAVTEGGGALPQSPGKHADTHT